MCESNDMSRDNRFAKPCICISYTTALRCIWILGARCPRASASKILIPRLARLGSYSKGGLLPGRQL